MHEYAEEECAYEHQSNGLRNSRTRIDLDVAACHVILQE